MCDIFLSASPNPAEKKIYTGFSQVGLEPIPLHSKGDFLTTKETECDWWRQIGFNPIQPSTVVFNAK